METNLKYVRLCLLGHLEIRWVDFLPCQMQILVCVVKGDQIFYNGSDICLAHAQRKFVEVVLYLKFTSSLSLTSVESFMLVSGIAQSWLLAA